MGLLSGASGKLTGTKYGDRSQPLDLKQQDKASWPGDTCEPTWLETNSTCNLLGSLM